MGGSSSNGGGGVEAPNSLVSNSLLKIQDLLCEGPIKGFAVMGGAYGNDPLAATTFNDVQVRNTDGSYNFNISGQGFSFSYTLGTPGQVPMVGFEKVTCSVPLPPDTRLSNPPANAGLPKTVLVTFNTQQYPDANAVIINWRIPQMYAADDNGNINGFEVDALAEVSLNGGSFTRLDPEAFVGKNTTPYFRTRTYTLPITTPPQPFYQWTLRFSRTNQDVLSTKVASDVYVDSVQVVSASQYSYPNSVMVGLFVDALQFGTVPARAYLIDGLKVSVPSGYTPPQILPNALTTHYCDVTSGVPTPIGITSQDPVELSGIQVGMIVNGDGIPTNSVVTAVNFFGSGNYNFGINQTPTVTHWDNPLTFSNPNLPNLNSVYYSPAVYPDVWNGTFTTGVWTSNPAWVFYDFITNPRYGLGQYINTDAVDIWTLYQISQFCDQMVDNGQGIGVLEPQFTCNVCIQQPADAYNMLLNLSSVFRGMLYYANGTIRANLTDDKTPVFNYTNANVANGAFNYSSTARTARHNAVQVKYTDPLNLYRDNYVVVEDNQGIIQYGYNKKEIDAFACTSLGQATRVANWILLTERLRTETVTFQVGMDGLYIRPGDVFNLYDNYRMNKSQGGRVVTLDSTQTYITLDRPVALDSGCIYGLTCMVPTFNLDATGDLTGSNQIPLIRNPQTQTRTVLNANVSGFSTVQVDRGFSGLSANAVWILSATGVYTPNYVPTVFEQAPQYECLSITQSSQGVLDITALKYNTGINYVVNTGFTTIMNPVNTGDRSPPAPVSNFTGHYITGQLSDASFYAYLNLTWGASASANVAGYLVSGNPLGTPVQIGATPSTGLQYFASVTGRVDFTCVAVGKGGGMSAPQSTAFVFPTVPGLDPSGIRFWLLPDGFGDLEQVGVFYERPSPAVTNTRVFMATGFGATFTEALDTSNYPVQGAVYQSITSSGSTLYLQTSSYDAPLTLLSQGARPISHPNLAVLVENELMMVADVSGAGVNQYALSVSRAALGTFAVSHPAAVSGWAFYLDELNSFHDDSFISVFKTGGYETGTATRYFQIQNLTATVDGAVVPATPGVAYTLPNPLPDAASSLTATAQGGPIVHLTWTAPPDLNILQYQVWRAVSPFSTFNLVGYEPANTFFDDTSVTVGTTYQYYVITEATNDQTSVKSNVVTVTPPAIPTGANLTPPSDPTAPLLAHSGYYQSYDGNILNSMSFTIWPLPNGAIGQYLLYGTGTNSLMVGNDVVNSGTFSSATVADLTPGQGYYFATQAYSPYGVLSNQVLANGGNAIVAPGKAPFAVVNPPTNLQAGGAAYGKAPFAPPKYTTPYLINGGPSQTTLLSACTGSWTASIDNDIAFYEYQIGLVGFPPSASAPIDYTNTVPGTQNYTVVYKAALDGLSRTIWVRSINRSSNTSAWVNTPGIVFVGLLYAGDMGSQSYTSTVLQTSQIGGAGSAAGVKIGDRNQAPNQINAYVATSTTLFITGGGTYEQQSLNISNLGFNAPPSAGFITCGYGNVLISYNPAYGGQTSSKATLDVNATPGSTLPASVNVTINYQFTE